MIVDFLFDQPGQFFRIANELTFRIVSQSAIVECSVIGTIKTNDNAFPRCNFNFSGFPQRSGINQNRAPFFRIVSIGSIARFSFNPRIERLVRESLVFK